jgi:hypothetical protein
MRGETEREREGLKAKKRVEKRRVTANGNFGRRRFFFFTSAAAPLLLLLLLPLRQQDKKAAPASQSGHFRTPDCCYKWPFF